MTLVDTSHVFIVHLLSSHSECLIGWEDLSKTDLCTELQIKIFQKQVIGSVSKYSVSIQSIFRDLFEYICVPKLKIYTRNRNLNLYLNSFNFKIWAFWSVLYDHVKWVLPPNQPKVPPLTDIYSELTLPSSWWTQNQRAFWKPKCRSFVVDLFL